MNALAPFRTDDRHRRRPRLIEESMEAQIGVGDGPDAGDVEVPDGALPG